MNRRELLIGASLASLGCTMPGVGSSSDPYVMPELPATVHGNQDYAGRTQVASALVGGENTGVIMVISDSTASNVVDSLFSIVNTTKNQNFNPYNGATYLSAEPMLGCTTNLARPASGNFLTRVADSLITAGTYARVIVQPLGVSSTVFADWEPSGAINGRIGVGYRRLLAAGLTPTGVVIMIGPNDKNIGTGQSAATTSLSNIISSVRDLGITCPIFIPRHSIFALVASSAVQLAQGAVLDSPNRVYTGGDMDSLTASGNYWDNTHFNSTGAAAAAALLVAAITAHP